MHDDTIETQTFGPLDRLQKVGIGGHEYLQQVEKIYTGE